MFAILTYFGLVGNRKLEWKFDDPLLKCKIQSGTITSISFGHRELKTLPNWVSYIWNNYLRNNVEEHSATHAFIKLHTNTEENKDNVEDFYLDYNGSVNVYSPIKFENGNELLFFKNLKLEKPIKFQDFIEKLLIDDIPVYHPTKENCKKFSEKVCNILFGNKSFEYKYLQFLHRRRE